MSTSWLQRKRKGELQELAQLANLPDAEGLLKDDLVEALHNHLEANETIYGKQAVFSDFYARHGSPIKRERSSPVTITASRTRRRGTLKGAELEEATPEKPVTTRTPRTIERVASKVSEVPRTIERVTSRVSDVPHAVERSAPRVTAPRAALASRVSDVSRTASRLAPRVSDVVDLPASPSQLAEVADQSFQAAKTKASEIWEKTRIEEAIDAVRENASSVVFIQLAVLLVEAASLQYQTLQTVTVNPPVAALQSKQIQLPDLTMLLTSDFWAPATLWSLTSWALPLLFSYFFNLTRRSNTRHKSSNKQYTVDPLTFNIARALLAYSAYSVPVVDAGLLGQPGTILARKPGWGPFADATVNTVREHVPGKYAGLQIGSIIGILVSIYDAALKK